ncbi:MAG: CHRD domain-containing protein [Acidobacteria bacterium]|nr:CHRD domain-containing protein [Acidobacteriota bacterium]
MTYALTSRKPLVRPATLQTGKPFPAPKAGRRAGPTTVAIAVVVDASWSCVLCWARPAEVNGLLANPEGYYLNLHTTANPGGAVRGQLAAAITSRPRVPSALVPVSERTPVLRLIISTRAVGTAASGASSTRPETTGFWAWSAAAARRSRVRTERFGMGPLGFDCSPGAKKKRERNPVRRYRRESRIAARIRCAVSFTSNSIPFFP